MTDSVPTSPTVEQPTESGSGVHELHGWLHRQATRWLRGRQCVTMQPTALVNDAFVKLIASGAFRHDQSRSKLMMAGSRALRDVIVGYVRHRFARKRWNGSRPVSLDRIDAEARRRGIDLVELNDLLETLTRTAPLQATIVELRFFGGFTMPEIAAATGKSLATVEKQWSEARAWLAARLGPRG